VALAAGGPWLGGLAALPAGAAVALPAFRLSGLYLAMATFSFALLVRDVFLPHPGDVSARGATRCSTRRAPSSAGCTSGTDVGYYYVVLAIALSCLALAHAVNRGRLGRLLRAMADAPLAVHAHGTNTNVSKFMVFCVSGLPGRHRWGDPFPHHPAASTHCPMRRFLSLNPGGGAVHRRAASDPQRRHRPPALYILLPGYITSRTVQPYIPISFGVLAIAAAVLVGRSLTQRAADRLAASHPPAGSGPKRRVEGPSGPPGRAGRGPVMRGIPV